MRNQHVSLGAVLAVLMLLSACSLHSAVTPPSASLPSDAQDALSGLTGVTAVDLAQKPSGEVGPDRQWDITLNVTVAESASIDDVVAVAEATADFSEANVGKQNWVSTIAVENVDHDLDDDTLSQSPAQFQVYPTVWVSAGADAREVMQLRGQPGVERVAIAQGFPWVTVTAATDLAGTREFASGLELWRDGGSIWAEGGRVRLMDIPDRLTDEGMNLVIATSIAYPSAQFWLEAMSGGSKQWPRLYIDQLTTEDAVGVTKALTGPSLPAAMVDNYDLEFVIRANTADGTTVDSGGVVGTAP